MGLLKKWLGRDSERGERLSQPGKMTICLVTRPRVPAGVEAEAVAAVVENLSEQEPRFKSLMESRPPALGYEFTVMTIVDEHAPFRKTSAQAMKAWVKDTFPSGHVFGSIFLLNGTFDSSRWDVPDAPPKIEYAATILFSDPSAHM